MLQSGEFVRPDCDKAEQAFKQCALRGPWGTLLRQAFIAWMAGDLPGAYLRYRIAAELGYRTAQASFSVHLGSLLGGCCFRQNATICFPSIPVAIFCSLFCVSAQTCIVCMCLFATLWFSCISLIYFLPANISVSLRPCPARRPPNRPRALSPPLSFYPSLCPPPCRSTWGICTRLEFPAQFHRTLIEPCTSTVWQLTRSSQSETDKRSIRFSEKDPIATSSHLRRDSATARMLEPNMQREKILTMSEKTFCGCCQAIQGSS